MKPVTKVYRKTFQDFSIKTRFLLGNRDLVANPRTSTSTMIDPVGFDDGSSPYHSAVNCLQELYFKRVKPIEEQYLYWKFDSPPLTSSEIAAKPMIMLLGQYSTGKTSFIQYLLGRDYPGAHIGPEPTVNYFSALRLTQQSCSC